MKKLLYSLLAGATMLLGSCSKDSVDNLAPSGTETTFTVSMAELETRVKPTETIDPTRYVMEVWSADGTTAENVIKKTDGSMTSRLELGSGSFTALLDKTKAYTCLFWADGSAADNNTGVYNAASLKAVALNAAKVATEAYYAKVDVAKGTNPAVAVTMKRAVAKVTLVETDKVKEGKTIAVTCANNTTFNVLDGTAGTTAADYTSTVTTAADHLTGKLGEVYMLSSVGGETVDMTIKYADETAKSLTNVPIKQNFNTNIKGEFSNFVDKTFSISSDDQWNTPDNDVDFKWETMMQFTIDFANAAEPTDKTYIIPFATTGTTPCALGIEWGDGTTTTLPQGTDLSTAETAALLKHTYTAPATEYQITITTVEPATKTQMPAFKPGFYRTDHNNKSKLKSMDSPMLNTGSTDFAYCFDGCSGLTGEIPAALFAKNTAVTSFKSCFSYCSGLTGKIPVALFAEHTAVTDFKGCFNGCSGLTGDIPAALFAANTAVTDFSFCFSYCSGLTGEIPAALFAKHTAVTDFAYCFYYCSKLTGEIPAALFAEHTAVTSFNSCFAGCSGLTGEIPATLFAANTAVTDFSFCFTDCSGLTGEIPAALFAANTAVTYFINCFAGCSELAGEIPAALFAKHTAVTSFFACFKGCSKLTGEIPAALFAANTAVTDFSNCFRGCSKATLNAEIFSAGADITTRFKDKSVNFTGCFKNCGSDASVTDGGTAPALWNYTFGTRNPTKTGCFDGVTKVTNYSQIPKAWGGPLE